MVWEISCNQNDDDNNNLFISYLVNKFPISHYGLKRLNHCDVMAFSFDGSLGMIFKTNFVNFKGSRKDCGICIGP